MPSSSTSRIPPTSDWDEFERLCKAMWRRKWNDPNAERHGRRGQRQAGVDVFGRRDGSGDSVGVQCKAQKEIPTTEELEAEVEKAKKFKPPLKEFTLAYTAERDVTLQDHARKLSLSNEGEGLFRVYVYSWDDMCEDFGVHKDVFTEFFGGMYREFANSIGVDVVETKAQGGIEATRAMLGLLPEIRSTLVVGERVQETVEQCSELLKLRRGREAEQLVRLATDALYDLATPDERVVLNVAWAKALVRVGDYDKASTRVNMGLAEKPGDTSSESLLGLIELLRGREGLARGHATAVLEECPSDPTSAAVLMFTVGEDVDVLTEWKSLEAEEARTHYRVVLAVANILAGRSRLEEAEQVLREHLARGERHPDVLGSLAYVVVEQVSLEPGARLGLQVSDGGRKRAEEAKGLASEALKILEEADEVEALRYIRLAKAEAMMLLREAADVVVEMESAISRDPDCAEYWRVRGLALARSGRVKEACDALRTALEKGADEELRLSLARMLRGVGEPVEAQKELETLIGAGGDQRSAALLEQAELYLEVGASAELEETLQALEKDEVARARVLLIRSRIARLGGRDAEALGLLERGASEASDFRVACEIAEELYELGEYGKAIGVLEKIVDHSTPDLPLRMLVDCYYKVGRLSDALGILEGMPRQENASLSMQLIIAGIYAELGRIESALEELDKAPQEGRTGIWTARRAHLLFRQGRESEVDEALESIADVAALGIDGMTMVSELYFERGRKDKALEVAYACRDQHKGEPQAHLRYVQMFHLCSEAVAGELDRDDVSAGSFVRVSRGEGDDRWLEIVDRERADPTRGEVGEGTELGQALCDGEVGQKVVVGDKGEELEILEVQHKYVRAFQDSLGRFNEWFPGAKGIEAKNVGDPEKDGGAKVKATLYEQLERREEAARQAEGLYAEGRLPLVSLGRLLGGSTVSGWSHIVAKGGVALRCARGTAVEQRRDVEVMSGDPTVVLDMAAVLTLVEVGLLERVVCEYACAITQSTIDEWLELRSQVKQRVGDTVSVALGEAGVLEKRVRTEKEAKREESKIEDVLSVLRKECEIVSIPAEVGREERREYERVLGEGGGDALFAAKGEGRCLASADLAILDLAESMGVRVVGVQGLLKRCMEKGVVDRREYSATVSRLIDLGYEYISLDGRDLLEIAKRGDWLPTASFERAAGILAGARANPQASLIVVGDFLLELWTGPYSLLHCQYLTHSVLNALCVGGTTSVVISALRGLLQDKFREAPERLRECLSAVGAWERASGGLV